MFPLLLFFHKCGVYPSAACGCDVEKQTADQVVLQYPIHRSRRGVHSPMRQLNGCSTPAPRFSAALQCSSWLKRRRRRWRQLAADLSLNFASCRGGWSWMFLSKESYGGSLSCRESNTQPSNWEADIYHWAIVAPKQGRDKGIKGSQ